MTQSFSTCQLYFEGNKTIQNRKCSTYLALTNCFEKNKYKKKNTVLKI